MIFIDRDNNPPDWTIEQGLIIPEKLKDFFERNPHQVIPIPMGPAETTLTTTLGRESFFLHFKIAIKDHLECTRVLKINENINLIMDEFEGEYSDSGVVAASPGIFSIFFTFQYEQFRLNPYDDKEFQLTEHMCIQALRFIEVIEPFLIPETEKSSNKQDIANS